MAKKLMILDTADNALAELAETFGRELGEGCDITVSDNVENVLENMRAGLPYDLVVLDYEQGDGTTPGPKALQTIREFHEEIPIIAVAKKGNVELANQAISDGATDFLVRGGKLGQRVSTLLGKIRNLLKVIRKNRLLDEQNMLLREAELARHRIIGESQEILSVIAQTERVAKIPRPVLIVGERGTGKELIARAIHAAAGSASRPIVVVNCAAFTDSLLESELFGHEKGSFTGADSLVHGKFEMASSGTLFLDEIGNMTLAFQQKILRVVEYGAFTRVGGSGEITTDARIIAATNCDLKEKMQCGEFLRDLYDRLTFEIIIVPPLRERTGDIRILANHFLNEFMKEIPSLGGKRLSSEALRMLEKYDFPGNVRELKNIIERAAYRDTSGEIEPENIGLLQKGSVEITGGNFEEKIEFFKKRLIEDALEEATGNQAQAARILGISYHQFRYYHKKCTADL